MLRNELEKLVPQYSRFNEPAYENNHVSIGKETMFCDIIYFYSLVTYSMYTKKSVAV